MPSRENPGRRRRRRAVGAAASLCAAALSGCMGFISDDPERPEWTAAAGPNYAVGSTLSTRLEYGDRQALAQAFLQAMAAQAPAATVSWSTARARGEVTAGEAFIRKIYSDPERMAPAPPGLDSRASFETELGEYVARDEVPLRIAPEPGAPEIGRLRGGDVFMAAGRIVDSDWLLVERDGKILGYVPGALARPRPGRPPVLAGGPRRAAEICRRFTQSLTVGDREDHYTGMACRNGDGQWRIEYSPPPEG